MSIVCAETGRTEQAQQLAATAAEYRKIIDLDDRTKIAQQFMAVGEILGYRRLDKFGVGSGTENWKDYQSWTHELTLAEVILHGRELIDEEAEARERVESRSKLRQAESEIQALRKQIGELSAGQAEWIAWKQAEVRGEGDLMAMRGYLQEHIEQSIPLKRNGVIVKIVALGDDAVAVSEDHGIIRLSDEELQQGRVWVCKKMGVPVIATWLPIGESRKEGQRRLQIEQELDAAQAEIQSLQRELARHLPPPRALLECSLRRWCTKVKIPYQEETLTGAVLDAFICQASELQLLKFIDIAQRCYFIGKYRRRRIQIIQQHLKESGETQLYRGDSALVITGMDDQGRVLFANGDKRWLDTDAIERFWARIVGKEGQRTVGGNADVAVLQRYLCAHPGACIPIQQGKDSYRLMIIDDDALGITDSQRLVRLFEEDIEQAHRWVESNRDTLFLSRLERTMG